VLLAFRDFLRKLFRPVSANDFPRSRDAHYFLQAILPNFRDFDLFYERIREESLHFTPCSDLSFAYRDRIDRFAKYAFDESRFVHAMPGIMEGYRIAFTKEGLLLPDARLHQLLYYQDQLILINARLPYRPGFDPDTPPLETMVGPIHLPIGMDAQKPFLTIGYRDHAGRMLWYESEVNQHLRFLVDPQGLKNLIDEAHRQFNLSNPPR